MRHTLALALCTVLLLPAGPSLAGEPWTPANYTAGGAFLALHAADCAQMWSLPNRPDLIEANPLLGRHPSRRDIAAFCLGSLGLVWIAAENEPAEQRTVLLWVVAALKAVVVAHNKSLGLSVRW